MENKVEFCTNPDGARIAYTTLGNGPAMVWPPAYMQALGMYLPGARAFYEDFARYHTVVLYDARGAGLSERSRADFTFESELRDLETIIDHLNLDKVILAGNAMAGPISIAYAVRHPERVTHLFLYGSYAYYGKYIPDSVKASIVTLLGQPDNWLGARTLVSLVNPKLNSELVDLYVEVLKKVTTPDNFARFMEMFYTFDVTDLCPRITARTLIVHASDDMNVDFRAGLELASLIPNARFVPWGGTHLSNMADKELRRVILEFLGDPVPKEPDADAAIAVPAGDPPVLKTEKKKVSWLRLDNPLVYIFATVLASVIAGIILTLFRC